jgi:hypothetical protein
MDYENGEDTPTTRDAIQSIWDILKTGNDSIRELGIPLPNGVSTRGSPDNISAALKLALSPDNQVEVFDFCFNFNSGVNVEDLGQVLEDCDHRRDNNIFDIEIHADAFVTFCHQSKVRKFQIATPMKFFEGEFGAKNTQSLLYLCSLAPVMFVFFPEAVNIYLHEDSQTARFDREMRARLGGNLLSR